ncbi:hypothetical protein [Archangium lansingense]|uniref:Uncharacterized protein n=1 Tax=Archangium lansingense TaxID=2995310 RepID=A0ABT3ZZK5_9BACT|nr:hypothetical protein [Archangium lansinium]MCY1074122.1 hypothetical protein [Archangium lansinium]
MKKIVPYALVPLLGLVAWTLWAHHERAAELEQARAEMSELRASMQQQARQNAAEVATARQLLEQTTQVQVQTARRLAAAEAQAPTASTEKAAPASPPDVALAPEAPTPREISDHVEEVFYQEPSDPQWEASAVQGLRDRLTTLLPEKAQVRSLECHSSLCRLELSFSEEEQLQRFMSGQTQGEGLWKGASMTFREENTGAEVVAVSYLVREGHSLPFPPEGR